MKKKNLTLIYSFIQSSYWMSSCIAAGFAANFLQGKNFDNSELGMVSALGNLLGIVVATILAAKMDKSQKYAALKVLPYLLLGQLGVQILLLFVNNKLLIGILFGLFICSYVVVNTPILKIYADAGYLNIDINYSLARGIGSLSYVVISFLLGPIIDRVGIRSIIFASIIVSIYQLISYYLIKKQMPDIFIEKQEENSVSLKEFILHNKNFSVMLFGTIFLFISHNFVTGFLINVVRNVGGSSGDMGFLNGFMAVTEIPVMIFYTKLLGKRNQKNILIISYIAFTLKALAFALSNSLTALTLSYLLQAPSFAFYAGAIVPYIERNIDYENAAKAQSLAFTMTNIGAVLANMIAGYLYDSITVSGTLYVGVIICLIGSIISVLGLKNHDYSWFLSK